jgi:hypothetical protein
MEIELCKPCMSLSRIDLPGGAFGAQHSGGHEVVQSRLLRISCLRAAREWKKDKAKDERRTETWGQCCRSILR